MFENSGKKLKSLAKIIFWILLIIFFVVDIIISLYLGNTFNAGLGFLAFSPILIVGYIVSYLTVLVLYAFGELVENTYILQLENRNKGLRQDVSDIRTKTVGETYNEQRKPFAPNESMQTERNKEENSPVIGSWFCSSCDENNSPSASFCKNCGLRRQ